MIDLLNEDPDDTRRDGSYYIFEYKYNDESGLPAGKQIGQPLDLYENHPTNHNEFMLYYRRHNPGVWMFFDATEEQTNMNKLKFSNISVLDEIYIIWFTVF